MSQMQIREKMTPPAVRTCIGYTLSRKTLFLISGQGKYD